MASKFLYNQAIEDSNAINQSPKFNWKNMFSGNQGIPSSSLNVEEDQKPYFSGDAEIFQPDENLMSQVPSYTPYTEYSNYRDRIRDPGLPSTEVAQKKPFMNWDAFPSPMNAMKAMMGAVKDNPTEAFNRSQFTTYGDGSQRIAKHPMDNVFANKNVSSILGSGDLSIGGQNRTDRITNAINAMNEDDPESGKFSKLYKNNPAAWKKRLTTLQNRERVFANQLRQYNDDLVAKGLKEKSAVDLNKQRVAADRAAGAFSSQVQRDPGGSRDWQQQTQAKERQGVSVAGPGFGKGSYFNQGGRAGYANGQLVSPNSNGLRPGYAGDEKSVLEKLISPFKQIFSGQTGAVLGGDQKTINEFNVKDGWGLDNDFSEETISMIIDMNNKGMDLDTIVSLTGGDKDSVLAVIQQLNMKADGGRAGYQGGELVEQQTDLIEGPQGGEEFQETVVEGQEQPSREQLEALAMEIFQTPLEELDEQQLLVVYQEAMQGRPMEESVQEEDVQFAAQGGLAGLL